MPMTGLTAFYGSSKKRLHINLPGGVKTFNQFLMKLSFQVLNSFQMQNMEWHRKRCCHALQVSGLRHTYRSILEVESLIGLPQNLGMEVYKEGSNGVLVGFPNASPKYMLSLHNIIPLGLSICTFFPCESVSQQTSHSLCLQIPLLSQPLSGMSYNQKILSG